MSTVLFLLTYTFRSIMVQIIINDLSDEPFRTIRTTIISIIVLAWLIIIYLPLLFIKLRQKGENNNMGMCRGAGKPSLFNT